MSGRLLSSSGASSWRARAAVARPYSPVAGRSVVVLGPDVLRPSSASYSTGSSAVRVPSIGSVLQAPPASTPWQSASRSTRGLHWAAVRPAELGTPHPPLSSSLTAVPSAAPSTSTSTAPQLPSLGLPPADLPPIYPNSPAYDARRFTSVPQPLPSTAASTPARALPPSHPASPAYLQATTLQPVRRDSFGPVIPLKPTPPPRDMRPTPPTHTGLWKMYFLAKEYFRFLYGGVKESYAEWREKNRIRRAMIQEGHQMTYRDLVLFRRVKSNNRRMLPFLFLALTIEELIPLLILFAPQFVPTTGLLPSQAKKMQRDLEDKLVRHRSAVYTRLTRAGGVNPEDGTPVFPGGWRGDGFLEWKSEEIKEILKVFSWPNREPTRSYLEDHARNVVSFLEEDDRFLSDRPPAEGFTADEFRRILSARGLLSVDMPEEDLPAKLDAYLTAYRATPAFHPFEYVFRDILATQPEAAAALAERDASKAREEEVEKAANGGYSGWKAVARKAFIESDPLPTIEKTVEKKIVKPTDPGLSPVHTLPKASLSPSLSSRPSKSTAPVEPTSSHRSRLAHDPSAPEPSYPSDPSAPPRYQLTEGPKPPRPSGGRPGSLSKRAHAAKLNEGV